MKCATKQYKMCTFTKPKVLLAGFFLLALSSCKKDISETQFQKDPSPAEIRQAGAAYKKDNTKKVFVTNAAQLYASINDPANEGSTVVLAPGTYLLNPNHPNAGRLELQRNMSLIGQHGNAGAVIIDVSGLPPASYVIPPTATYPVQLRTGPIRIGNGYNAIEWITFINSNPANLLRSVIQTDIVSKLNPTDAAPGAQIRIAHTKISGGSIGLNILNRDAVSDNRVIEAEVENNEIFNNTQLQVGSGVQIQNSQGVKGGLINVTMQGNYIHGNRQGLDLLNSSNRENNRIIVRSSFDRLEENGVGLVLNGGLNAVGGTAIVTGNSIQFEAKHTSIQNNGSTPVPLHNYIAGGVFISGGTVGSLGNNTGQPRTVNNNNVVATFKNCRIENNVGTYQINAFGAYSSLPSLLPAGSNNSAVINLQGANKKIPVNAVPSFPVEAAGTNKVIVLHK